MPFSGIKAIKIDSLPTCDDYGTPLLIVSNQPSCANSTAGTSLDSGVLGECQAYSSGVDIGSVEFQCYASGISAVPTSTSAAESDPTQAVSTEVVTEGGSGSSGGSDNDSCCICCCVVM